MLTLFVGRSEQVVALIEVPMIIPGIGLQALPPNRAFLYYAVAHRIKLDFQHDEIKVAVLSGSDLPET